MFGVRYGVAVALWLAAGLWLASAAPAPAASPYANWAAIVVAGDWRSLSGAPSPAFDNARRDVAAELVNIGFNPSNIQQFSMQPGRERDGRLLKSNVQTISDSLQELAGRATAGCLLYFTSHWRPGGLGIGNVALVPDAMAQLVDEACQNRPTVIVVSACYSGFLIPKLEAPNRLIMTAARKDRTSFGCGQGSQYPYFDECILAKMPVSSGFEDLADKVRTCVARLEQKRVVETPSEPQLFVGSQVAGKLPEWR